MKEFKFKNEDKKPLDIDWNEVLNKINHAEEKLRKGEHFKKKLFALLQCGSYGRAIEEVERQAKTITRLRKTLEEIDTVNHQREDALNRADEWSRKIRDIVTEAIYF